MRVYFAGGIGQYRYVADEVKKFRPYMLYSYYYADKGDVEPFLDYVDDFMLDSGTFSYAYGREGATASEADLHAYLRRYAKWINKNHIDKFFELDVDDIVGYKRVLEYRDELHDLTGRVSIPVWHIPRGGDEFLKMCEEFPYVAIGGIASKDIEKCQYPVFTKMIKEAHRRGAKIHGLGFTSMEGMERYHFDSVDSSAWATGSYYGHVDRFDGRRIVRVKKPKGSRVKTVETAKHNFREWVKFQRYAEVKL